MSTTLVRKEDVQRKWYVLDAADKPLGRTAVIAANLLRGKLKPDFTPNVDCGDYVIIVNVEKAVLTGRKLEEKYYRRHSGWIGGLKETKYKTLMAERPEFAMELAVKGMLPKNTIGRTAMTRLKLFKGPEHIHAAQKPEAGTQDESGGKRRCTRARNSIITAPAAASPLSPVSAFMRTAPVPLSSTAARSTTTSVSTP